MKDTLLIPLAGYGRRFEEVGYTLPKQMLNIMGVTSLEYSLQSIDPNSDYDVVILLRTGLMTRFDIRPLFEKFFNRPCTFIEVEKDTRGSLETCFLARNKIDPSSRLHIFTMDVRFEPSARLSEIELNKSSAHLSLVKTNNPGYSYAKINQASMLVERVVEKRVISKLGITGLYSFGSAKQFFSYVEEHLTKGLIENKEFYISEIFSYYINKKATVSYNIVDNILSFGIPDEYEWCVKHIKAAGKKHLGVASDHSGFEEKSVFLKCCKENGVLVSDFGCFSKSDCDYPEYVAELCQSIRRNDIDFGISFCRSGQGVNIAANKFPGIRSVIFSDTNNLEVSLRHNLPNHLAVPSDQMHELLTPIFFEILFNTRFEGGRHQDRLMEVSKHEN